MKCCVVVIGLGIVLLLGNDLVSSWEGIIYGCLGIGLLINVVDVYLDWFIIKIVGEVKGFDIIVDNELFGKFWVSGKDVKKMDLFIYYGFGVLFMVLYDLGLEIIDVNVECIGVIVGVGIGGLFGIEEQIIEFYEGKKILFFYVFKIIINMLLGQLSIIIGLKGLLFLVVLVCVILNYLIGIVMCMIQYGDVDVMVVGGVECGLLLIVLGGFCVMKVMSICNDVLEQVLCLWDKDCDGFVLGDGVGILILEEYEYVKVCGVKIYCELVGFGVSFDVYYMIVLSENGEGVVCCMVMVMKDVGVSLEQVGYFNVYGIFMLLGDLGEIMVMKIVFGDYVYKMMVSFIKLMIGYLLGVVGGVEVIFLVMVLQDNVILLIINLQQLGEGCDLDYVFNEVCQVKVDVVMFNGFGFGGINGMLIFKCV